ncbi:MAG: hydroxymethylbilane synthase [Actinomycetota bacterium]
MTIRLATRSSRLALWQAEHVAELLRAASPGLSVELVPTDTAPDLDLSIPIAEFGGKGAFGKEVQELVLAGHADAAVHSAKDLQAVTPDGLTIGAVPARGTVDDCLVGARLAELGPGSVVATGSNRRAALLRDLRPGVEVVGLRGNIETRLAVLEDGAIDAIVMATVALERLAIIPPLVERLDAETFVPQVGQGALAVECRADDAATAELLASINHGPSRATLDAERSFLRVLGGDCDLPAGAHASIGTDGKVHVRGVLTGRPGEGSGELFRAEVVDLVDADPGAALAARLVAAVEADGGSALA